MDPITLFTLPATAAADVAAYFGQVITNGWVLMAIVIGIPVAFYLAHKVIGLVTKHVK